MAEAISLTVAICTFNRANLLKMTLDRLQQVTVPADMSWKLLVVNNRCTDHTEDVIEEFSTKLPIQHIIEETPGLSHARNRAVREAKGDYLVWTDDDVLVGNNWLEAYREAMRKWPHALFFGGPISPRFEKEPPAWLKQVWRQVATQYSCLDLGTAPILIKDPRHVPFGANFAVKLDEQRRYPFDPRLGPRHGLNIRGDETTMLCKMLADGGIGRWVPSARVEHFLPQERLSTKYLRSAYFGLGYQGVLETADQDSSAPRLLRTRAFRWEITYGLRKCLCTPQVWVQDLERAARCWGRLAAFQMLNES